MTGGKDTIYALASGPPPSGIAVVRVSGPAAEQALTALTGADLPPPRRARLLRLLDREGALIDEALVLRFPEGASFTGEALVELHCHGGRAVVRAVMDALEAAVPCRMAEPGEFTLRAYLYGRIDLADAEALGDLVSAETERQRRQAARLVSGALRRRVGGWREKLIRALALVEVTIDWADEEVPEEVTPEVAELLGGVLAEIDRECTVSDGAERLRNGFEVAIIGAPNAGKSSLLNALAGREAAITSPVPGTTRDVVELRYDLDGYPVVFLDMAGLRETDDPVERIGVARARERAAMADLRIALAAPDAPMGVLAEGLLREGDLKLRSKADKAPGAVPGERAVSAETGEGVAELLRAIAARLSEIAPEDALVAHRRQRVALEIGAAALLDAQKGLEKKGVEEVSEDLRRGIAALERLIGAVGVEDMLDEVFGNFCLGK